MGAWMEIKPENTNPYAEFSIQHLCARVLATQDGRMLFDYLKQIHIYSSPFMKNGNYSEFGGIENYLFFRQGQADIVRYVEQQADIHYKQNKG